LYDRLRDGSATTLRLYDGAAAPGDPIPGWSTSGVR